MIKYLTFVQMSQSYSQFVIHLCFLHSDNKTNNPKENRKKPENLLNEKLCKYAKRTKLN